MLDNTMTTAERLAAHRAGIAPLAARLGEVEAELASLAEAEDPADLAEALEVRKTREATKWRLDVEQKLLLDRLAPLREQIATLEAEAQSEAKAAASEEFEADILEASGAIQVMAAELLRNVEVLREQLDLGRNARLRQSVKMRNTLGELSNTLARANNTIRGGLR